VDLVSHPTIPTAAKEIIELECLCSLFASDSLDSVAQESCEHKLVPCIYRTPTLEEDGPDSEQIAQIETPKAKSEPAA
jgi:hypothetical protein